MEQLVLVQIVVGVLFLAAGFLILIRPKRSESEREDLLALGGTFLLVLGFLLLVLLVLK